MPPTVGRSALLASHLSSINGFYDYPTNLSKCYDIWRSNFWTPIDPVWPWYSVHIRIEGILGMPESNENMTLILYKLVYQIMRCANNFIWIEFSNILSSMQTNFGASARNMKTFVDMPRQETKVMTYMTMGPVILKHYYLRPFRVWNIWSPKTKNVTWLWLTAFSSTLTSKPIESFGEACTQHKMYPVNCKFVSAIRYTISIWFLTIFWSMVALIAFTFENTSRFFEPITPTNSSWRMDNCSPSA